MKILHTSDWHLGQNFYSYDRHKEYLYFASQLCEILCEEKPDALVVCGDVFDVMNPSRAIQKLFVRIILKLHECRPQMSIIVVAGNHDSGSLVELYAELWVVQNVFVVGNILRNKDSSIDYDRHIVPVSDGCILAVPFVNKVYFPTIEDVEPSQRMRFFHQMLLDRARTRFPNSPIVMTGHLALMGSDCEGHDEEKMKLSYVDIAEVGMGYDYLALGHIHKSQRVKVRGGESNAFYCGSPMPINFDENYTHSVNIVEVKKGTSPMVKKIPIKQLKPLLTIPSKEGGTVSEILQAVSTLPNEPFYLRVMLKINDVIPLSEKEAIESACNRDNISFCLIQPIRNKEYNSMSSLSPRTVEEIRALDPISVAKEHYLATHNGEPLPIELEKLLLVAISDVSNPNQ